MVLEVQTCTEFHTRSSPSGIRSPRRRCGSVPAAFRQRSGSGSDSGSGSATPREAHSPKQTPVADEIDRRSSLQDCYHRLHHHYEMLAGRLEKHRERLKDEFGDWQRRLGLPCEQEVGDSSRSSPTLLSVEPLVAIGVEGGKFSCVAYRAQLRIFDKEGREHTWQTEPFTLDELLKVVVTTRTNCSSWWCSLRNVASGLNQTQGDMRLPADTSPSSSPGTPRLSPPRDSWSSPLLLSSRVVPQQRRVRACALRLAGLAILGALFLTLAWATACAARPVVRFVLTWWPLITFDGLEQRDRVLHEWLASFGVALVFLSVTAGFLAGIMEVSFLPAKAILQLERKDETAQVREHLQWLLLRADCLKSLDVCNFLNLGMATYYGSSETQKEGRCFCRRHPSAEVYFAQARRRRCSFMCFSCDWRWKSRNRSPTERWVVLREDGLALFSSLMDEDPTDMLCFDTGFSLFRDDQDRVLVCSASWVLELDFSAGSGRAARSDVVQSWCNAITLVAQLSPRTREQRFGSFAPIRRPAQPRPGDRDMVPGSLARFLVGGRATFRKIAEAILVAEHEILIAGWWVSPHLPLVRGGEALPGNADPRLSALLHGAASRGVRVFVLLWHESFLANDSEWAEVELRNPNVYVVRHRSSWNSNRLWSHHEKVVVVDQQLAFLGGLDLCLGRYDDAEHRLGDSHARVWEGQDYSNARIRDFADVRNTGLVDILDRKRQPRMPWQDIHCQLLGHPACDVARHFIERWNHAKSKRPQYTSYPTALLRQKAAVCNERIVQVASEGEGHSGALEMGPWQECTSQVVRSVCQWSAGTRTESSAHTAYCDLLQDAERFVYIENQFFCSGMDGDEAVGNRVAEALVRRVIRAHAQREKFHVMIVLPLLPALDGSISISGVFSLPLLNVMYWQYSTFAAMKQRLEDAGVDMSSYISVYGLRKHERLQDGGPYVTEQVYVHSKVMVVDDRVSIIGSANLNDRSLLGLRDSEVCVVLRDAATTPGMLGGPWQVGGFGAGLRKALFAQHLGWGPEELEGKFADPLSEDSLAQVRSSARKNTQIYEELFGVLPSDQVRTWAQLSARRAEAEGQPPALRPATDDTTRTPPCTPEVESRLSEVRGHLVEFPLEFLADEDLKPPAFSVGSLATDAFN